MQKSDRRTFGQGLVSRTLSTRPARESEGQLSETSQVFRLKCTEASSTKGPEEEIPVQIFQIHQVLPNNHSGLGGSRPASLSTGIQYVESFDSSEKFKLPTFGLQFQLETCEDIDYKRA